MTKPFKCWKTCAALWAVLFSLAAQTASTSTREVEQANACFSLNYQATMSFNVKPNSPEGLVGDFNGDDLPDLIVGEFTARSALFVPGDGTGRLDIAASIALPKGLNSLAAGDFNSDAIPDVVGITAVDDRTYNLALLFGDGTGRFRDSGLTFPLQGQQQPFAVADFNGDGKLDLAMGVFGEAMVVVYLGDGTGRFGNGLFSRSPSLSLLIASDFNGDGKPDLAAASRSANNVAVLLNDGAARFTAAPAIGVEADPYFLLAEDFNRDGRRDLIALKRVPSQFQYLLGDGQGGFINLGGRDLYSESRAAAVSDLNQDGLPDLVAISPAGTAVYLNNGGNGFASPLNTSAPSGGKPLLADFNNDGQADLLGFGADGLQGKVFITLGAGQGRFMTATSQTNIPVGAGVGLGDFNADGNLDLALTNALSSSLTIQLGDGTGRFTPTNVYSAGRFPLRPTISDFNGDDKPDLAIAVEGDNQVLLFWGDGRGGFTNGPVYTVGSGTSWLVAGDFNGDGKPDLAVNSYNNNSVLALLNTSANGTGSLGAPLASPAGLNPRVLAAADFNGDGRLDLAVASLSSLSGEPNSVSLLLGDGAGRFSLNTGSTFTPSQPYRAGLLAAGDFDGDGAAELAVNLGSTNTFTTPHALAILKFRMPEPTLTTFPLDAVMNGLVAADFNGDGRLDLASASQDFSGATLLLNDGRGGFARRTSYSFGNSAATLAAGDLNSDGRPDLLITHGSTNGLSVILSACAAAPPFVTTSAASYRRARLAPASIVTAFGAGLTSATEAATTLPLPTTLAGTSVLIKDAAGREVRAPLFFVSPTQINYQLPAEATTGVALITINRSNDAALSSTARLDRVVPALFSADASGQGLAAALALRVKANGAQSFEPIVRYDAPSGRFTALPIDVSNPSEQVFLVLFGTGLRNRSALAAVTGAIGGERGEVLFAGAQGNLIGADQINLRISPRLAGRGEVGVVVTAEGKTTNVVRVAIK